MLVVEKAKALALRLNNPDRVFATIPTAKPLRDLVVVPHRLDEVKVLRNIGIKAPSPIEHYYDWPGIYKPFEHQLKTASFLTVQKKAIVLNDIGTGKTMSVLWAADYLLTHLLTKPVLIMSPLSTLERVWGDEIFKNFPHRSFAVLHGTAAKRRQRLNQKHDFYIINHDGFPVVYEESKDKFGLVVVDEAAVFRNPSTKRFKMFRRWLNDHPNIMVWLLTGTPTPNEPTDAWALANLIDSPNLTGRYSAFKDRVMVKVGQWKWIPRKESPEIVQQVLQPSIRFTRSECLDLPETIFQTRQVPLTKEQQHHWDTMLKHYITEAATDTITAVNEAVKVQKLIQLACGVAYNDSGENVQLDCAPRVTAVKEIIEEAGEKVIVFVPLTGTLHMLEAELAKMTTVAVVNGQVSATQRNQIFRAFQDQSDPKVLVAHPGTMSHGLTLTSATTVVWYGPINSNEVYVQANGRVERIGKNRVTNVIHIEATELERRMFDRLQNKQKLQGLLLDLIQQSQDN